MASSESSRINGILAPTFLSSLGNALVITAVPNLIVQKVCSPRGQPSINDFICNDSALVAEATSITVSKSTIRSFLSAVSSPLFGYWRDATGDNKRLLYIGEVAEAVCVLFYVLAACYWTGSAWVPAVLESLIGGFFGASVYQLGSDCIIIEGSKPEERTMRLQLFGNSMLVSFLLATVIRGFFLTTFGYSYYFLLAAGLHIMALILVKTSVRDERRKVVKKENMDLATKLKAVFKQRPNSAVIWTMLVCKPFFMTFFQAECTIGTYYLQQAFQFTVTDETLHGSYSMIINVIGSFTMPLILIQYLKWSDFKIGIVSSFLAVISAISMAFAKSRITLYMIPFLDLLKYNLFSIPHSILSKCIRSDELGLFNGLSSILGIFLPFGINHIYQTTFSATSQSMPGAIYLLSAAGNTIVMILFCMSAYLYSDTGNTEEDTSEAADKEDLVAKKLD